MICPVAMIGYQGEELRVTGTLPGPITQGMYDQITGLQYGTIKDTRGWLVDVPVTESPAVAQPMAG